MKLQHALPCGSGQPTQCVLMSDGHHAIVSTEPAEPSLCGGRSDNGGLLLFDIRRLGGANEAGAALVARIDCFGTRCETDAHIDVPLPRGVTDIALVEEQGERIVFTIMDGYLSAFDLLGGGGSLSHKFDFDILNPLDADLHGRNHVSAIAATGRNVFTATTAPSLGVWWRPDPKEPYGHNMYVREPPPPLQLRARFTPLPVWRGKAKFSRPPTAVEKLEMALEHDRLRLAGVPRMRPPFEPFVFPDEKPSLCELPCCQGGGPIQVYQSR